MCSGRALRSEMYTFLYYLLRFRILLISTPASLKSTGVLSEMF